LWLKAPLNKLSHGSYGESLIDLCGRLAPALSVSLDISEHEVAPQRVITGNDWVKLPGDDLIRRISGAMLEEHADQLAEEIAGNLRPIYRPDGTIAGRMALLPDSSRFTLGQAGALLVGGLRVEDMRNLVGVLEGVGPTVARDHAQADVELEEIARWATEQSTLFSEFTSEPHDLMTAANAISEMGGQTGDLPICETSDGFLGFADLVEWAKRRSRAYIVDLSYTESDFYEVAGQAEPFTPADNVIVLHVSGWSVPRFLLAPSGGEDPDAVVHGIGLVQLVDLALAIGFGADPDSIHWTEEELVELWEEGPPIEVGHVAGRPISIRGVTPVESRPSGSPESREITRD
jgi:hypothetical protein